LGLALAVREGKGVQRGLEAPVSTVFLFVSHNFFRPLDPPADARRRAIFIPKGSIMITENSDRKHLFKKGVSGNPSGKPRGAKSKSTQLMSALFGKNPADLRAIVAKTVESAKAGKPWAVELILARPWPVPKGRAVTFPMADIVSVADI
jgi:hypothetical protein